MHNALPARMNKHLPAMIQAGPISTLLVFACLMLMAGAVNAQSGCISITANGGNGNGSADNTTAFNTTALQLGTYGGCIAFPPGKYRFNSSLTVSFPTTQPSYSLTLVGAGADNTILFFPETDGLNVTVNTGTTDTQGIHIRDLTFTTGQAGGHSALTLLKPGSLSAFGQSDIVRTTFRGDDGEAQTDFWSTGINVLGVSNINFDGDLFYGNSAGTGGVGISLTGTQASASPDPTPDNLRNSMRIARAESRGSTAQLVSKLKTPTSRNPSSAPNTTPSCSCGIGGESPFGILYNIAQSGFYKLSLGLNYDTYIQGVAITQSVFSDDATGIMVPSGAIGATELTITGSTLNASGYQIDAEAPIAGVVMSANVIHVNSSSVGVYFHNGTGFQHSFVNNVFTGSGTASGTGIAVILPVGATGQQYELYSSVTGNIFTNLAIGVDLTDGLYWNVQGNTYDAMVTMHVLNTNPTYQATNKVGIASN